MKRSVLTVSTVSAQRDRRRSFVSAVCCAIAATTLLAASPARADDDEPSDKPDARLQGYGSQTNMSIGGGTAGAYLTTIILGAIAVSILFKGSGRTHLD